MRNYCGSRTRTQLPTNQRAETHQFDFPQLHAVMSDDNRAEWDVIDVAKWVTTRRRNWRDHVDTMGQDRWASWAKHQKPSTNKPPGRPPKTA
jgi:hypothetical protein